MTQYSVSAITTNRWPQVKQLANGTWERVWHLVLTENIPRSEELSTLSLHIGKQIVADLRAADPRLSGIEQDDVVVHLCRMAPREIAAIVLTKQDGWSDEYYLATYRLFEYVDEKIGAIDTIEGQPRDSWRPWRH